ncbi:MAG: ABC transporter ATP-binding protein [Anaerolineae bacterium]|nr:ABC transporter ATP-binding protein [Anaerolineales bacterium]MCQ3976693.1 ABC transporter ATP-binding protein [Anaerolineae bacterium]
MVAVRCQGLSKNFGRVRAVENVNLTLPRGRFLALLGPSGCGKTTTLRLLAGFEMPDQGEVEIGGRRVNAPGLHVPPEQRSVGMVFQEYALFPHLNVADNIAYGVPKGVDKKRRVAEMLSLVGLPEVAGRMPHELSGGQQQRVALARALAPQPALILLDEPFSNLDAALRQSVREEVRQILRQAGATAIFVTHDQEEALSLADEVAVMIEGAILQVGSPQQLYLRPARREVAAFVGEANFLAGVAHGPVVSCALGDLPLVETAHGPVEVLIRPEMAHLQPDPTGPGRVERISFFGHDQLVEVALPAGLRLQARTQPRLDLSPGALVQVTVEGPVVAYAH